MKAIFTAILCICLIFSIASCGPSPDTIEKDLSSAGESIEISSIETSEQSISIEYSEIKAGTVFCLGEVNLQGVDVVYDINIEAGSGCFIGFSSSPDRKESLEHGWFWAQGGEETGATLSGNIHGTTNGPMYLYIGSRGTDLKNVTSTISAEWIKTT